MLCGFETRGAVVTDTELTPGGTWKKVPGPHRQKLHPGALDPPSPPLPPLKSPSRC
jgi:hypothetical protein